MTVDDGRPILMHACRQSPAAFYVYSTVKIITAAPVTDKQGRAVCGTTSSFASALEFVGDGANTDLPTFTNINSNAEAYFGGPGIEGPTEIPVLTYTTTQTFTYTYTSPSKY